MCPLIQTDVEVSIWNIICLEVGNNLHAFKWNFSGVGVVMYMPLLFPRKLGLVNSIVMQRTPIFSLILYNCEMTKL